jgi:hypothetical protein
MKRTVKQYRDVIIDESRRWGTRIADGEEDTVRYDYHQFDSGNNDYVNDLTAEITQTIGLDELSNSQGEQEPRETERNATERNANERIAEQSDSGEESQDPDETDEYEQSQAVPKLPPRQRQAPTRLIDELSQTASEQRARNQQQKTAKHSGTESGQPSNTTRYAQSLVYTVKIDPDPDCPHSRAQAMTGPHKTEWLQAETEEFEGHLANSTWRLVPRDDSMKVLSGKWVYKVKRDLKLTIVRFKARWVVRGFEQRHGEDYDETFAATIRIEVVRWLLAYCAITRKQLRQIDFLTAFLNAEIDEEVYVEQPHGWLRGSNQVCRLLKALYGLKQAPHLWQQNLQGFMHRNGFTPSPVEPCLWFKGDLILLVWVDDILATDSNEAQLQALVDLFTTEYKVKDLGYPSNFIGIKILRNRNGDITLSQSHYLKTVLERFNLENINPKDVPLNPGTQIEKFDGEAQQQHKAVYASAIGGIGWAAICTRPDLARGYAKLARYVDNPGPIHFKALQQLFGYIKGTLDYGLTYNTDGSEPAQSLTAYSDADFAGCLDTRRSTGGYLIFKGNNLISWQSKLQGNVTLSTTEAEYVQLSVTARELVYFKALEGKMNGNQSTSIRCTIRGDNQGSIKLAVDPSYRRRTRHIDVHHHYVREQVEQGVIKLEYVQSKDNLADAFTKPLPKPALTSFTSRINLNQSRNVT